MAATTVMDTLDSFIREELPKQTMETSARIDPVYTDIIRSTQGVQSDAAGRSWEIMHRFSTGVSGLYEPRPVKGGTPLTNTAQALFYSAQSRYPNPNVMPHTAAVTRIIDMHCHHGNFSIPTYLLKPRALNSTAFDQIFHDLAGLSKLRAQMEAVSFYAPTTGALGNFPIAGAAGAGSYTGTTAFTFTPTSSRIKWWREGMMVDVFDVVAGTQKVNSTGVSPNAVDIPLVVDAVDYIAGTVKLVAPQGEDLTGVCLGTAALDAQAGIVFPRGVAYSQTSTSVDVGDGATLYQMGHYGLEDWIKDADSSTAILFNNARAWNQTGNLKTDLFSIANYPQFASKITTSLGGPLTDLQLNNHVGAFIEAYDSDIVDTMITTRKVVQKYIEQSGIGASRFVFERQGEAMDVRGGWKQCVYEYEGKTFKVHISPYCPSGTMYIIKLGGGNIKRFVPPRSAPAGGLGSPGTGMDMGDEIEFLMPLAGQPSIFHLVNNASTGQATPLAEAPFHQYSQIAPEDVRSIKIAGITESN